MNKFDRLESTNNHLETVVKKLESAVNNSNKPCKSNDDTRRVVNNFFMNCIIFF